MAKQLNQEARINLTFNADASAAKKEIDELSKALREVAKLPGKSSTMFNDESIKKASQAALELERHLAKAVNVNTGKLDLSRFSSSLKSSNKSLDEYYASLMAIGPEGQQAFLKISSAIASAEMPTARINARMQEFFTTLKNTARWQISSSILHGFTGALQRAYGYAQDLNESLNNIRIVTGASVEQMGDFAKEANKAARALSATTTEYTDAALIYYQQGLSDKEVAERTEATIKMANVSRQSAEIVSEQLTAVWNNFDDGSKSLEYYADVMTALGAATASSSEEIAEGLEKFAAVAETVGLSYEYATAALATVTSATRQSADVVGTAFKTLFARIQDLELGETLEDGVSLGKYSAALQAIGIDVLDVNGNVREMNDILDDMGDKWDTISQAQKVSVAQTVAGTRQYTQLIALMDNWDKFQENLGTAMTSEGSLDKQAQIYAESWEGARDRVTAAAEDIYKSLINDEFFIDLLDGAETALSGIKHLIDGFGGLRGTLTMVGSIFLQMYAKQMPETLNNLRQNLMVFTGKATKEMEKITDTTSQTLNKWGKKIDPDSATGVQIQAQERILKMKKDLSRVAKTLTKAEYEEYEARIKNVEAMSKETVEIAKRADAAKRAMKGAIRQGAAQASNSLSQQLNQAREKDQQAIKEGTAKKVGQGVYLSENVNTLKDSYKALADSVKMAEEYKSIMNSNFGFKEQQKLQQILRQGLKNYSQLNTEISKYQLLQDDVDSMAQDWEEQAQSIGKNQQEVDELANSMKIYIANLEKSQQYQDLLSADSGLNEKDIQAVKTALSDLNKILDSGTADANELSQAFSNFSTLLGEKTLMKTGQLRDDLKKLKSALEGKVDPEILETIERAAEEAAEEVNNVRISLSNLEGDNKAPKHTGGLSEKLTSLTGTAMGLYSAYTSVTSAMQTFRDESATTGDKIGSIVGVASQAGTAIGSLSATLTELGLTTAATAGPFIAIVALLAGLAIYLDKVIITQKEAKKAIEDANEAYEEEVEKLESLNNELETTNDRIQELLQKDSLTLIEEQELQRLRETNAELKRNIELQKEQTEAARKKQAGEFEKNAGALSGWADSSKPKTFWDYYTSGYSASNQYYAEKYGFEYTVPTYEVKPPDETDINSFKTYQEGWKIYYETNKDALLNGATDEEGQNLLEKYLKQYSDQAKAIYGDDYESTVFGSMDELFAVNNEKNWFQTFNAETNTADDIAASFSDSFKDSLLKAGIAVDDYAQYLVEQINETNNDFEMLFTSRLGKEEGKEVLTQLKQQLSSEDWKILPEIDISGEDDFNSIIQKIENYKDSKIKTTFITEFKEVYKTTSGLDRGDTIDEDEYNNLIEVLGDGVEDFFVQTADGEYQLIAKAEEFQKVVNNISFDNLIGSIKSNEKEIEKNNKRIEQLREIDKQYDLKALSVSAQDVNTGKTDWAQYQAQTDFLRAMGMDVGAIAQYSSNDEDYYNNLATAVASYQIELTNLEATNASLIATNQENATTLAATATSYDQLVYYAKMANDPSLVNEYAESVYLKQAEALDLNIEEMDVYRQQLLAHDKAYSKNIVALNQTVIANKRLEKGIKDLSDKWAENRAILEKENVTVLETSTALAAILPDIQNILNLDNDDFSLLPPDFVQTHLDLIQQVVNGAEGAVQKFRNMTAQSILVAAAGANGIVSTKVQALHNSIAEQVAKFEVGEIDSAQFENKCEQLVNAAKLTEEQMSAYFAALGLNVEATFKKVLNPAVKGSGDIIMTTIDGAVAAIDKFKTEVDFLSIFKNDDTSGDNEGLGINSPTPEHARRQQTKYTEGRYKELMDDLDDLQEIADDANRALNRLYGSNKLTQLTALSNAQKDINENLRAQIKLAKETYLVQDKDAAGKQGFTFDAEGHISNYDELMSGLYGKLNTYESDMAIAQRDGKDTTELENQIAAQEKAIQEAEAAAAQYEETLEKIEDDTKALQEGLDLIQDYTYQAIELELDLRMEINEADFKKIDRMISALGDDLFAKAEALTLMTGIETTQNPDGSYTASGGMGGYYKAYQDQFAILKHAKDQLEQDFANKKISEEDYVAGMKRIRDASYEAADGLADSQEQMKDYYAEVLAAGDAEFQKYMEFMSAPSRVLEHYNNILDLTGGEKDYAAKRVIYQGAEVMKRDQADVQKAYYDTLQAQADEQKRQMEDKRTQFGEDSEAYKQAKAEWEAAQQYANQAQDAWLSAVEEWAQAVRDTLENEMAAAADELEKALTNGMSFDELNTAMERTKSLQEEWLTTTNQIYETNKLMRTAQQELDKTTNQAAKAKLKSFIEQTQQLQEQEELSEFELKMQQSRYDLLLAEIALEEAQNAKSTVRLQRDSEGNFGYVYTADQDKISEAQQNYDDAENALYNLGLEGYNEYTEKYQQTKQEMYEELTAITEAYYNGEYESQEAYEEAMLEAQRHYSEKLADYTYLANVAMLTESYDQLDQFKTGWFAKQDELEQTIGADADNFYDELLGYAQTFNSDTGKETKIFKDAWATSFTQSTGQGATWKVGMSESIGSVNGELSKISTQVFSVAEAIFGSDPNNPSGYIGNIKTAFDNYETSIKTINEQVGLSNKAAGDSMAGSDETSVKSRAQSLINIIGAVGEDGTLIGAENSLIATTKDYKEVLVGPDGNSGLVKDLDELYKESSAITDYYQTTMGGKVDELKGKFDLLAESVQSNITNLINLNNLQLNDKDYTVTEHRVVVDETTTNTNSDGGGNGGGGDGAPQVGDIVTFSATGTYYEDSWGGGDYGIHHRGEQVEIKQVLSSPKVDSGQRYYIRVAALTPDAGGTTAMGWTDLGSISGYDTGGYTGDWGPDGKLAVLHEKELILNAHDTENMLMMISMVRDMMSMIDIPGLASSMISPLMGTIGSTPLEQSVHIEASFPGVSDRNEIEEAFNNLINTASQYINRKSV